MATYLLDSNILSDMMRNPRGRAMRDLESRSANADNDFVTSVIVACELRYGAVKKGSPKLVQRLDEVLASLDVLSLDRGVEQHYANIRSDLERRGNPIGQNDLLIAAHAIALDAVLVTDNVGEFERVEGLRLENWLRS